MKISLRFKKLLSFILTFSIILSLLPSFSLIASAATVTVLDGKITITDTANSMKSGNGVVTVTATGSWISKKSNKVTIKNSSDSKSRIRFDYSVSNYSSKSFPSDSGTISKILDPGASFQEEIISNRSSTATLILSNFAITPIVDSTVKLFFDSNKGSVTVNGNSIDSESSFMVSGDSSGLPIKVTANEGFQFFGWKIASEENHGTFLSFEAEDTLSFNGNVELEAVFVSSSATKFGVGTVTSGTYTDAEGFVGGLGSLFGAATTVTYYNVTINRKFDDLNDAAIYASGTDNKYIVLLENTTLSSGTYNVPQGVTLLIPFDADNTLYIDQACSYSSYTTPTAFRTLTLEEGAKIVVDGAISVSGKHVRTVAGQMNGSAPTGPQGFIATHSGSEIVVNNGGSLYAWGYITGDGKVTANSGSKVYELFQIADFRGGSQSTANAETVKGVFPISQYYVQNIESELIIYSGATEYAYTTIYMSSMAIASPVAFIGSSGCMFNMGAGSYVTKKYDGNADRMILTAYGNITVDPIEMPVGSGKINSKDYVLPITNNFTVSVLSGSTITMNQDMAFLPGSKIIIDSGATCKIGSGKSIFVYDANLYTNAYNNTAYTNYIGKYCWGNVNGSQQNIAFAPLKYAPGRKYDRKLEDLTDAEIIVSGTVDASAGYIYTTDGGAAVKGTDGAIVKYNPGSATVAYQLLMNINGDTDFIVEIPVTAPVLTNGDGSTFNTISKKQTYKYENGKWICFEHGYNSVVTDFTCTEQGYTTHTCEFCGDSYIDTYVPASHRYSSVITAPTCTEQGYTTHTCTGCGDSYVDNYVDATGHSYNAVVTPPTCTERGYTTHTCTDCGDSYVDNYVEATGHSYNAVVTPPTCTEQGYTTHTCTVCGDSYDDNYVVATGHSYNAVVTPPTCTDEGFTTHTCTDCGNSYVDNYVGENGHDYDAVVTDPTCTEEGFTTYTCTVCGNNYVGNYVDAHGHKDDGKDHVCDYNCGVYQGVHADGNNDHLCDYGCTEKIGTCEDADFDHACDYGCDKVYGEHKDEGKDHACDYGCQVKIGTHEDTNSDHKCEYGCDEAIGACEDKDLDHDCDYGCDKVFGDCSDSDTDNDHVCDYGCGKEFNPCSDVDTDNDHNCDICGKQNVTEHDYTYGEYVWNDDFSSCTRTRTCNCTYSETAIATITSIVKSPATCEGKGWTTYTATFTEDWAETQTKDVEDIEPLGHRFTNESDSECDFCEYTRAAYIGDVSYVTFEDALAAAKEGDTIVVLSQIVIEGERTLDLTGITLDSKYINFGDYAMVVRGDLTIVGGTFNFENYYGIGTTANGKLTINGGKYSTTKDYYLIGNFGETVINDGEFTSLYCNVNSFDGTVIINGGTFTVTDYSYPDYPPCDVFAEEKGEAIINGGNFSTDVSEHCPEGHTIKVENGRYPFEKHSYNAVVTPPTCTESGYTTFTCVCGDTYVDNYVDAAGHSHDAVVTPPTCTEQGYTTHTCNVCGDSYIDNYVDATGHSYDDDFDATCNNGCGHVREAKILVAMIGNTKFDSLSEAVNTAKYGETIVLCKDVTLTEKLVVATTQKWDFGSYTVTLANGNENYSLVVKSDLTIESGTFVVSGWYGIGVTGKLTVNNGKIEYSGYNDYLIGNWGETVINGGVFNGQYCCVNNFSGTTVINDGEFTTEMKDSTGDYDSCDLFADSGLSVNGGNFSKDVTIYCDNDHHTCDVDGDGRFVYEKHSYDSVVTDPTCTEEGYTTYTCHCGDSYIDNYVDETGHLDNNHDHVCENGCNEQIGSCEDTDFDHDCDYGCNVYFGQHKDEGYDHNCDYGCKEKIGTCEDTDFDHDCDYGCDKVFGDCSDSDTDNDHVCDYGCGKEFNPCSDVDTDNDHNCDICGKQNVTEHDYTYGEYVWNDDFSSCTITRTCNCTYSETANAKITSIVKSPATCVGKGWTTYTATFTEDWAKTQTKDVEDIEPLGHRFTNESDSECDFCEYTRAAYIGDVSYVTFEDALAAAKEGDTIVVLSQIVIEDERTLDLTGITLDSKYINFGDYAMVVRGDLTIVGGIFNFENYYGIGTTANGKLTINGGKYSTTKDYYLIGNFGETVINDGEFTSLYCNVNSFDGTVIINGGKFTVTDYSYPDYPPCDVFAEEKGEAIINGGNFSTDVSKHCPEGHTIEDENGRYPFEKHNYNAVVTPPTCTEGGYTTYTCVCGDTYKDNYVDAAGHSHDAVVTPPTCTEQGYTTHTCHCGDTYVDNYVDATGHKHGSFEYDLYKHWSICSVDGCSVIFDEVDHNFTNDVCECGAKRVSVEIVGNIEVDYSVVGQTVTVTHKDACTIAYIVDGEYVKLESVFNADGSYSFTSPDNIEDVKLFVIGDYDANGEITTEDATLLRDALLGKDTLNDTPDFVYDVNGDHKITALDLALISAAAQRSIKLG